MKSEKATIWILITFNILLLMVLIYGRFYVHKKNTEKEGIKYAISNLEYIYERQRKNSSLQVISDGIKLDKDIEIHNEKGENVKISHLLSGPVLVLRYSELNCQSCVDDLIKFLLTHGSFNENNTLILSYYRELDYLNKFKRMNPLNVQIYNTKSLGLPPDTLNVPYLFVLDDQLMTQNVFIPEESDTLALKYYLTFVANKLSKM